MFSSGLERDHWHEKVKHLTQVKNLTCLQVYSNDWVFHFLYNMNRVSLKKQSISKKVLYSKHFHVNLTNFATLDFRLVRCWIDMKIFSCETYLKFIDFLRPIKETKQIY